MICGRTVTYKTGVIFIRTHVNPPKTDSGIAFKIIGGCHPSLICAGVDAGRCFK